MSQEKTRVRVEDPVFKPMAGVRGLNITLEVVENTPMGNLGGTLTANPHASESFNKLKINLWVHEPGKEPYVAHVIEGQGRAWVMNHLIHQLSNTVLNSEWAKGF